MRMTVSHEHLLFQVAFLALARASVSPKFVGPNANPNSFKWTAWVQMDGTYRCAASLIDTNWVLTSADCVYKYVPHPRLKFIY